MGMIKMYPNPGNPKIKKIPASGKQADSDKL